MTTVEEVQTGQYVRVTVTGYAEKFAHSSYLAVSDHNSSIRNYFGPSQGNLTVEVTGEPRPEPKRTGKTCIRVALATFQGGDQFWTWDAKGDGWTNRQSRPMTWPEFLEWIDSYMHTYTVVS